MSGHYVATKDGPQWVGSNRGEVAHIRARLELVRATLHTIANGPEPVAAALAAEALRRSGP